MLNEKIKKGKLLPKKIQNHYENVIRALGYKKKI